MLKWRHNGRQSITGLACAAWCMLHRAALLVGQGVNMVIAVDASVCLPAPTRWAGGVGS